MSSLLLWPWAWASTWQPAVRPCARPESCTLRNSISPDVPVFGDALSQAWRQDATKLQELLDEDVIVDTPLWSCKNAADYLEQLGDTADFFSRAAPPQLSVLSEHRLGPGEASVEWVLGVEWPSLWGARVNLLGESIITFDDGNGSKTPQVREVHETWHQTPLQAFVHQVLPRRRDVMSLWNSPTAEHVPQKVERVGRDYEVRRLPPMLVVQAEAIETGEALYQEQGPVAPAFAFTGGLKRSEWYSAVSPALLERAFTTVSLPGGMEQPAQRRRWILPVPTRFGMDPAALPAADSGLQENPGYTNGNQQTSVQYVRRPSQRLVVGRVKGYPSNEAVLQTVRALSDSAQRDGLRVVSQQGRPVFIHLCYDIKNGFNSKGRLAMAVWLAAPESLQDNEVGLLLEED